MTNPDFRALCEELFVKLKEWDSSDPYHDCGPLLCRARTALTEQPVGPTDEELWEAWGCFEHEPFSKEDTIMQLREFLVRWGTPAIHPVPVAPTLKEQALKALKVLPTPDGQVTLDITDLNTIRRALEALND